MGHAFNVLIVCSDKKTGHAPALGVAQRLTSKPTDIANFLMDVGVRVVFCTYQSAGLLKLAQADMRNRDVDPEFHLGIFDK